MELNFWYHTLNCGFHIPMVGETDFPCISDERVGTGRTYVGLKTAPRGDAGFNAWVTAIKRGRLYFGDGRSHFIDYRINEHDVGSGSLNLAAPGIVIVTAKIAARIDETPVGADNDHLTPKYSYWHLERARIPGTRNVLVEVIVNGSPVVTREFLADGTLHDFSAELKIQGSSWIALRILPSGHTAPIFVTVADKPVRASKRSARWCLDCVDVIWTEKSPRIRPTELNSAQSAYDEARRVYRMIGAESEG
jgi:hypothetical protein